jgi:hypothetical protein
MRYAPKDTVVASHEVAANVMQTRRLAAGDFDAGRTRATAASEA